MHFSGWFPGASQSASGGPGDHPSGLTGAPEAIRLPCRPCEGATGLALCSVSCFGIGTSVSFPPTSHLEFLLAPPPASRAGASCLVRFRLRRGLGSAHLYLWEPDLILATIPLSCSLAGLLARGQVAAWPHRREAPCPRSLGLRRCCLDWS